MARRTQVTKSTRRETKARSKMPAATEAAEVEVVEEGRGLGLGDGMAIVTTLMLLVAIVMVDYLLGKHYGKGLFF
jgi:hypothetical protein